MFVVSAKTWCYELKESRTLNLPNVIMPSLPAAFLCLKYR